MGLVRAKVQLSNPRNGDLKPIEVDALVDTGAMALCLPEHVALQLDLKEIERREATYADERRVLVPYVSPGLH